MAHDYNLQMQRVTLVAPQTKALAQAAFGREGVPTFSPHLSVAAERMKVETEPPLTLQNLTEALKKQKNLQK
jgi:hypothetical protein